jgi:hypothetical protein
MGLRSVFVLGACAGIGWVLEASSLVAEGAGAGDGDTVRITADAMRHQQPARLVVAWTIGGEDADDLLHFDDVHFGSALATTRGDVWIAQGSPPLGIPASIRLFDRHGRFVRFVGRRGSGPGEFQAPRTMFELSDGRVVVRDLGAESRVLLFSTQGLPTATLSLPGRFPALAASFVAEDSAANILFYFAGHQFSRGSGQGVVRFTPTGRIIDTLAIPSWDSLARPAVPSRPPFWPSQGAVLGPSGTIATYRGDRYLVDLHPLPRDGRGGFRAWRQGDRVVRIERRVEAIRLSADERSDWMEQQRELYRRQRYPQSPIVPATKPLVLSVRFSPEGRLWVQVSTPSAAIPPSRQRPAPSGELPAAKWREAQAFDIFERDGTLVGQVQLPIDEALVAMRGDTVWVTRQLPSEVKVLRRYHLAWGR